MTDAEHRETLKAAARYYLEINMPGKPTVPARKRTKSGTLRLPNPGGLGVLEMYLDMDDAELSEACWQAACKTANVQA